MHTALEKHGEYGQSPDPGSQPGFIYSQESGSEISGGQGVYRHDDETYDETQGGYRHDDETYDETQGDTRLEPVYSPNDGSTYDSREGKHHPGDSVLYSPDDETYESAQYERRDRHLDDYEHADSPTEEAYSDMDSPSVDKAPKQLSSPPRSGFRTSRLDNMMSPRSEFSAGESVSMSEYSQTSAMRGAQELLKKNRKKRLEM